jgi:anti-sigma regulatory factor (Ser/Thr protein kinase)
VSTTTATATQHRLDEAFRHEAFFYAGTDGFVEGAASFIRDGLATEEPTLVVVSAAKIAMLRSELDEDARHVCFADMADVGANPARIIPAWRDFVARRPASGVGIRGIGEPIHPDRSVAELAECHRHESLLNVAFADTPGFRLMCPYDTDALDPEVVAEARRTHPLVVDDGVPGPSAGFPGLDAVRAPFGDPLPEPPADAAELDVDGDALGAVRGLVRHHTARAQLSRARADDFLVAVNEIATNSVRHGGGRGVLKLWHDAGALICEVRDSGLIEAPLVGRVRPLPGQVGGYGLWLANQMCDLVQIRATPSGNRIRLHMRVP